MAYRWAIEIYKVHISKSDAADSINSIVDIHITWWISWIYRRYELTFYICEYILDILSYYKLIWISRILILSIYIVAYLSLDYRNIADYQVACRVIWLYYLLDLHLTS